MSYKVVLVRKTQKAVAQQKLDVQVREIIRKAFNSGRGTGWRHADTKITRHQVPSGWEFKATIIFETTLDRQSIRDKWPHILRRIAQAGSTGNLQRSPFKVIEPTGYEKIAEQATELHSLAATRRELANIPKSLGSINLDPEGHFDNIYGRDAQIGRILGALHLAHRTEFQKRTHSLLDGPPGCGKSATMKAIGQMLGAENEAWMWFDATSTTKAGALQTLIEADHIPPVLFIEEIEKCEENSLRWLLGVMDVRGEIRRTNYRVGNEAKQLRMIVIATANDVRLLKSIMSGALYSRFQNKIYFPRPDRETMRMILRREIKEIGGKESWIEPTLAFAFDKWGITDPRDIITICSCGGDRLLSGDYQRDYEKTMHPTELMDLLDSREREEAEATKLRERLNKLQKRQ